VKKLSEYDQATVKLASAALGRVSQYEEDRRRVYGTLRPAKGLLFHYTSTDGFKGIIEKNELWATSAYFLNDSKEIFYGCQIVKEALDDWMAQNPRPETSLSLGLAQQLQEAFGDTFLNMKVVRPIFISCFCEGDNLLSQWRAYGKSGGYSLGFQVPAADPIWGLGFKPETTTLTAVWAKVEYKKNAQLNSCRAILDALLPVFDDLATTNAIAEIGAHPLCGYEVIFRRMIDLLLEEVVSFKSEAFASENEWRVVVRQRERIKQGQDDGSKIVKPYQFRSREGMLIPYVRLIPSQDGGKLPIAEVHSGPTNDPITTTLAVPILLEQNGFNARVIRSDISLRDF
jgi:hypothetical protein